MIEPKRCSEMVILKLCTSTDMLRKESLSSNGQLFYQYVQNKSKLKQWWSTIPPISTNQNKA